MSMAKKRHNGDGPATHHDMSNLAGEMTRRFDEMEGRFDGLEVRVGGIENIMATKDDMVRLEEGQESMKETIARLERGQQAMLGVLQSIDEHFRDHRNVPERAARFVCP